MTSLFVAPPLFGLAGVMLGISAVRRGDQGLGTFVVSLSIVLSVFSAWLALQLVHRL